VILAENRKCQCNSSIQGAALSIVPVASCTFGVHAPTVLCSALLQEQINTAAFKDVWQEIGRRGMEGMGSEQKVLLQVHQVGCAVLCRLLVHKYV
jgi:hypothetical protein